MSRNISLHNIKFPEIYNQMQLRNEKLKDVANVIELDISQVSRKISGEINWSFNDIQLLCKHYNMDFKDLFRKEE